MGWHFSMCAGKIWLLVILFSHYKCCHCAAYSEFTLFCRSGWKRSRYGSWVKDENAEFDSDEDAPDI